MHVRKGDSVVVIAGNDKGKTGEVKEVHRERGRIIVEGINMRWKHTKPQGQQPGERVQKECSIHASNVMHWDAKAEKGVRKRPQA